MCKGQPKEKGGQVFGAGAAARGVKATQPGYKSSGNRNHVNYTVLYS